MTLNEVQQEIAEQHEFESVLFQADRACRLTHSLHELTMLRNRPVQGMAEELLAQRRALLDITIQITKAEFKRVARELSDAITKWEAR